MGCPRNKLIIGMGLYGRSFTLKDYHRNGLMAPVRGKGDAGKYTREGGFLAYYEVRSEVKSTTLKTLQHVVLSELESYEFRRICGLYMYY